MPELSERQKAVLAEKDAKLKGPPGYSRGDSVMTPKGPGKISVACIDKETGKSVLKDRYYWVALDSGGEPERFASSDLPAPPEPQEGESNASI